MKHRVQARTSHSHSATSTFTDNIGDHYSSPIRSSRSSGTTDDSFSCVPRSLIASASSSNIFPVTSTSSDTLEKSFRMNLFVRRSGDPLPDEVANPPTTKSEIVTQINPAWTHYQRHKPLSTLKQPRRIMEKMRKALGHMGKRKNFGIQFLLMDFLWMCVFISYWINPCSGQGKNALKIPLNTLY